MKKYILFFLVILISCKDDDTNLIYPHPTGLDPCIVEDIVPAQAFGGQIVTISGENFSEEENGNIVVFGKWAGKVISYSNTELQVRLPMQSEKEVDVRVAIKGSEFWGYWTQTELDTNGITITDTMSFTFNKAIFAIGDSIYYPTGVIADDSENVLMIINQSKGNWQSGTYSINPEGQFNRLRGNVSHGNFVLGPDDRIWVPNLRQNRETGWISSMPPDASASFSREVRDVVQPAYIDFDQSTGDLYIASRGYYEEIITEVSTGIYDTTIISHNSGILKVAAGTDTTVRVAEYSRAVSCKIYENYLYVTQADYKSGTVIMRNEITASGLGTAEEVLSDVEDIHSLEFDADGNMYFVPENESTLIRYNIMTGEILEFYPGDIIETANFLCWAGDYMYLVHTNIPDQISISATEPGSVQKVFVGAEGYTQN